MNLAPGVCFTKEWETIPTGNNNPDGRRSIQSRAFSLHQGKLDKAHRRPTVQTGWGNLQNTLVYIAGDTAVLARDSPSTANRGAASLRHRRIRALSFVDLHRTAIGHCSSYACFRFPHITVWPCGGFAFGAASRRRRRRARRGACTRAFRATLPALQPPQYKRSTSVTCLLFGASAPKHVRSTLLQPALRQIVSPVLDSAHNLTNRSCVEVAEEELHHLPAPSWDFMAQGHLVLQSPRLKKPFSTVVPMASDTETFSSSGSPFEQHSFRAGFPKHFPARPSR